MTMGKKTISLREYDADDGPIEWEGDRNGEGDGPNLRIKRADMIRLQSKGGKYLMLKDKVYSTTSKRREWRSSFVSGFVD